MKKQKFKPTTARPATSPAVMPAIQTPAPPKFVTGSLLRHILIMTGTGALGLMAIFVGDLANLIFLSWLNDEAIVAAVGYGSSILFLTVSIGIGLSIAATSLVSPAIGARDWDRARRLTVNACVATVLVALASSLLVWLLIPQALALLGATGRTAALATTYLQILVPALAPLALGMTLSGVLRSVGDARRAMNVTLIGAIVNIVLDPLLIFGLGLGLEGAAMASVISRFAVMAVGLYGVVVVHKLMGRFEWRPFVADVAPITAIAVPAILTNIATPFSNAYVTAAISTYGDSAVAGWTTIGRVLPVAFGAIYALSGTIGPILGQNYGAGETTRMREAFTLALKVTAAFTAAAWLILSLLAYPIASSMHATGEAERLIVLFCRGLSPLFVFLGALFVANAAFNTLGRPKTSMVLNWGRATLGTIPFVLAGGYLAGSDGVLAGQMVGGVAFGGIAVWLCYRMLDEMAAARTAAVKPLEKA
jgi:putative MATE family efflux protein